MTRSAWFAWHSCFGAALAALSLALPAAAQDGAISTQKPVVAKSQVRGAAAPAEADPQPKEQNADLAGGPTAQWIWGGPAKDDDRYLFRTDFEGGSKAATIIAACDNRLVVFINDVQVAESSSWEAPITLDVQKHVKAGKNTLRVRGFNSDGPAAMALKLALKMPDGKLRYVVTDKSWQAARGFMSDKFAPVVVLGKMGMRPWGDVFTAPKVSIASAPRDVFNVLPGFQVELLYTVPKDKQGSWVCVTTDPKGRIIASDQEGKGLYRITPPPIGGSGEASSETKVEALPLKMTACQGMLFAFDSLYCSVNGGAGSGLYRVPYDAEKDTFGQPKLLFRIRGGGEHGPHAIRLSPDGKSIYLQSGNHTLPPFDVKRNRPPLEMGGVGSDQLRVTLPEGMSSRQPANWDEDLLLPRQWDSNGHARGILAPGGWIAKTDPDGKTWEMHSVGYRNAYDMAFNADGELFSYDSDMEWDMGASWYRPTRVCHATSGSEFGWRSGSGVWPSYYPDSLPPVLDMGPGSPVGVEFGYGTKFPAKYQKALYLLDWTFGTIYAIHLKPQGSTYSGEKEEFLSRTPLPLTDATVGKDGALYFAVGGRGTQSELFRVTYVGKESTARVDGHDKEGAELRNVRHSTEEYHGPRMWMPAPTIIDSLAKQMGHEDRFIRYAARIAVEHQHFTHAVLSKLLDRESKSIDPSNAAGAQAAVTILVAAAREADKSKQPEILSAFDALEYAKLSEGLRLDLLRAYQLAFIRLGQPDHVTAERLDQRLDKFYPAKTDNENRELVQLLVFLNSPTVIGKTLKLMEQKSEIAGPDMRELIARNPGYAGPIAAMLANHPDLQRVHYAFVLRNMKYGWTLEERKQYFGMLAELRTKSGGASYQKFIDNIRADALLNATQAERKAIESDVALQPPKPADLPKPIGPGRKWTVDDMVAVAKNGLTGRSFEGGRRAYAASRCVICHRFGGEGGATGPDLTNVAGRFSPRDLAESLVEPSKVVSDQYRAHVISAGGKQYTGRVLSDQNGKVVILVDAEDATKVVELAKDDIDRMEPSKVSLMPNDLMNVLNQDEVLDMVAYLLSRGDTNDRMFKK